MGMYFVEEAAENRLGTNGDRAKGRGRNKWAGELMTEEEKRLTDRVSILQGILSPFVCAIYNGQAHDWDREAVFSMLTGKHNLKGEDLPARLTKDDVMAYIDKLFAQHESKAHA